MRVVLLSLLLVSGGLVLLPGASASDSLDHCFSYPPNQFPHCAAQATGSWALSWVHWTVARPGCLLTTPPVGWDDVCILAIPDLLP